MRLVLKANVRGHYRGGTWVRPYTRGSGRPRHTPPAGFLRQVRVLSEQLYLRTEALKGAMRDGRLVATHPRQPGAVTLLAPSARRPGWWQETYLRDGVPEGHREHRTPEDAIQEMAQSGWEPAERHP